MNQSEDLLCRRAGASAPQLEQFLQEIVEIDTATGTAAGIRAAADVVERELGALDFRASRTEVDGVGPHLVLTRGGGERKVVLTAHTDTVLPIGNTGGFRKDATGEHYRGAGVADCKGGIAVMLGALRALREGGELDDVRVDVVLTADEETGSESSRALFEERCADAACVLVFEPGRPDGSLVDHRRGNCVYHLACTGISAHAGADASAGASAIEELAHKIVALQALAGGGVGVNVGVLRGGTKRNVVPDFAEAEVDARFDDAAGDEGLEADVRRICDEVIDVGCAGNVGSCCRAMSTATSRVTRSKYRPAWPRGPGSAELLEIWRAAARELGLDVGAVGSGGSSDGSFAAARGVPTLDGLGIVGGGYHTREEYAVASSLEQRTIMSSLAISRLLASWTAG